MPPGPSLDQTLETVAGTGVRRRYPFSTGNNSVLDMVELADGRRLVAKRAQPGARLDLEGFMLQHLARCSALPVPYVLHAEDTLLVLSYIETSGGLTESAEVHAADLIAALHKVTAPRYGFAHDTLIGPLPQPNPESDDWIAFFRDHRLLHMARAAHAEGRVDAALLDRLERLAERLPDLLDAPHPPTLIHGDLWGGNVLTWRGRIAAFIDPAIYHADPEIELAFSTLFSTFGEPFFRRYQEHHPIRPGFFELRRDLYNLYPLLVHVRLFGGSYATAVDRIVRRLVG